MYIQQIHTNYYFIYIYKYTNLKIYNISDPYQMFGATSSRLASSGKLKNTQRYFNCFIIYQMTDENKRCS